MRLKFRQILNSLVQHMKKLFTFSTILAVAAFGGICQAQTSGRVHTVVVPFGAGGSTDVTARIVAEKMAAVIKSPVIVDNKPGGGSRVAATATKNAAPDGTTMLLTVTATAAIVPFLYEKVNYSFPVDYAPVAQIGKTQIALIVPENSPHKTLADLIKHGKQHPRSLNFGASGIGTMSHLTWYRFGKTTGVDSVIVPFKSGSSVLNDLIAGHIDAAVDTVGEYVEAHQGKKVRVLAVFGNSRLPTLPDVPTAAEQGIKGINAESWFGVFVPARTPAPVIKQLQDAIAFAVKDQSTQSRLERFAIQTDFKDASAFGDIVQRDIATWSAIVKESGIKPE